MLRLLLQLILKFHPLLKSFLLLNFVLFLNSLLLTRERIHLNWGDYFLWLLFLNKDHLLFLLLLDRLFELFHHCLLFLLFFDLNLLCLPRIILLKLFKILLVLVKRPLFYHIVSPFHVFVHKILENSLRPFINNCSSDRF